MSETAQIRAGAPLPPLSAISPLGTARGSVSQCIHDSHALQIVEEAFLSVLSVRQSRLQADRTGVAELLGGWSLGLPARPADLVGTPELACAWIEPRAWIVTSNAALAPEMKSIAGLFVTDVSDRVCAFRLTGLRAIDVIAAGCDPAIVPPARCTRARFGSLAAVILQRWTANDWRILVDVSLARAFAHWLADAAANTATDDSCDSRLDRK